MALQVLKDHRDLMDHWWRHYEFAMHHLDSYAFTSHLVDPLMRIWREIVVEHKLLLDANLIERIFNDVHLHDHVHPDEVRLRTEGTSFLYSFVYQNDFKYFLRKLKKLAAHDQLAKYFVCVAKVLIWASEANWPKALKWATEAKTCIP